MKTIYSISLRKFFPFLLLIAAFCVFSSRPQSAQATLSTYKLTTGTGSQINISGGNVLWTGSPRRLNLASGAINIGFNFVLDGTTYTQMQVYCSGMITLGPTATGNIQSNSLATTTVPTIAGFWANIGMSGGASAGQWSANCGTVPTILYQTTIGTAPNRVTVVEFRNVCVVAQYTTEATSTWQIRLYETSYAIELLYVNMTNRKTNCGYRTGANPPTSASIGVTGGVNNFMSITPTGGTSATSSSAAANNSVNIQSTAIPALTMYTITKPPNVQLSVTPKSLTFGSVSAGFTSAPQFVTVTHVGTQGTLVISSATITGNSDFKISCTPPSNSYAVGQSGQYCITFTPQQAGLRQATLTITSNGIDSGTQTVTLTGVGIIADYTIDSTIMFKKTRTRLGDSLTKYVHIKSTGQAPLFFSSFVISGIDAGQYFVSYFPVNPLQPGQSDSIGVTYVPTLEGKHVATLTLTSNSFTYPTLNISLQGTGILPHIVITPQLLLFDSTREGDTVCKNITIWNPGTDTLRILSNSFVSNDGDFHYVGLTGSDTAIAPDRTKTVTVCFIPLQQGLRQARLVFRTNIINTFETPRRDTAAVMVVDIRGTGVPFGVFANSISGSSAPDSALIGTQVCRMDTLKNNGDADITVTGYNFNGAQFSLNGLPAVPFVLKARTSKVFNLCAIPDKEGLIGGTLTFTGRTGGSNINSPLIQLAVFGLKGCVSATPNPLFTGVVLPNNGSDSIQCVKVINCGNISAVYTPTISGAAKADYTFKPAVSGTVKPGDTTVFCIDYKPTAVSGVPAATASFDVASSDQSSVKVPLLGVDGCAVLTSENPQIPNTGANEKKTFTFTISNTNGTFEWIPGTENISGTGGGAYKIISIVPNPIPAGGTAVVTVEFHPPVGSAGQDFIANIKWPNAGPCGNALSVDLNGHSIVSSVKETANAEGFILDQSYPNPTQGKANFSYVTPKETEVRITLVDLTGKLIRTLISGRVSQGEHTVNFDASNLPSGTYMYILESGSTRLIRQIILTK